MPETLLTEFVFSVLLITSLSTVGLLALWAATSSRYWFVRTAVFLACILPLVFVPAYEPLVPFFIQGAVVAGGVWIYRRRWNVPSPQASNAAAELNSQATFRFSILTLLLLTVVIAVLTPIAIRLPALNQEAWISAITIGVAAGVATLAAGYVMTTRRRAFAWLATMFVLVGLGIVLAALDWFVPSIVAQASWPPAQPITPLYDVDATTPLDAWIYLVWPIAMASMFCLMLVVLSLIAAALAARRLSARAVTAVIVLMVAAFPLWALVQLLAPVSIPSLNVPNPNGYDDIIAAGFQILDQHSGSPLLNTSVAPTSNQELAAEVEEFKSFYDRIALALSRPCVVPIDLHDLNNALTADPMADVEALRAAARSMLSKIESQRNDDRHREAAETAIDTIRLGVASGRGGVMTSRLVENAFISIGYSGLYHSIDKLDATSAHEAIVALEQIERDREPLSDVIARDRIYDRIAHGWYGKVLFVLTDVADSRAEEREAINLMTKRAQGMSRLVLAELAVRQFKIENGEDPESLQMLVPKYVSEVPVDPCNANGSPLHYKKTPEGFLLYSVGFDGDDDGGRPASRENGWFDDGDFRLDEWFKETEPNADEDAPMNPDAGDAVSETDAPADEPNNKTE